MIEVGSGGDKRPHFLAVPAQRPLESPAFFFDRGDLIKAIGTTELYAYYPILEWLDEHAVAGNATAEFSDTVTGILKRYRLDNESDDPIELIQQELHRPEWIGTSSEPLGGAWLRMWTALYLFQDAALVDPALTSPEWQWTAFSTSSLDEWQSKLGEKGATPIADVTIPQHHELGFEAEVDFGEITIDLAGQRIKAAMFVMRLSASGKGFCKAYLNETQDALLDGHIAAFEFYGGIPTRIRYDNLAAAVVEVLEGRSRLETDRFKAMRSHYGVESFFCRPGIDGAHEKGGVEGEVGRFRRRHLVPVPTVSSMDELNATLLAGCVADGDRVIGHRRTTVDTDFGVEAAYL